MLVERRHAVWLYARKVGVLHQRGDHTRFIFDPAYWEDPNRPILGLRFEEYPKQGLSAALRLPPWFSNLLPESRTLRDWIASDRGVSPSREMELLAQLGHDLPGAVRVFPDGDDLPNWFDSARLLKVQSPPTAIDGRGSPLTKFSLAGVGLKFSLLPRGRGLTIPASGEGGDWIVKLPETEHAHVPRNEFATMSLAARVGIDVPQIKLRHRDELPALPENVWPSREDLAYSIRRFDRDSNRNLIHTEDLAQVRGFYPDNDWKYRGAFETIAAHMYRGYDLSSLHEFVRRLVFCVLVGNGDAHLKNWSLIYRDARRPTISPAYDLVATFYYQAGVEDLGLTLNRSRRFADVRIRTFDRIAERIGAAGAKLESVAEETIVRTLDEWPAVAEEFLADLPEMRNAIDWHIQTSARMMRSE
jgi:serine/threonine-protein kinase HipA